MNEAFTERLRATMAAACMSPADLAVWFERPQKTAWVWATGRYAPRPDDLPFLEERLNMLDRALALGVFPKYVSRFKRPDYVKAMLDEQLAKGNGLSVTDPA
jgi:hypothetical protein